MPDRRRAARTGAFGLAVLAGGVVAGALAEELVYRRLLGHRDISGGEPFGSVRGTQLDVRSFDGTTIATEVYGPPDAPAIVFLHGFTLARDVWHYQLRDLSADGRFRLVAFDARGHGGSGPARGPDGDTTFDSDTLARDLWSVIEQATSAPAVVVGHSMGGMTLQALVAFGEDFPAALGERVRGLVLLNTTFTGALGLWRDGLPRLQSLRKIALGAWETLARQPGRLDRFRLPVSDISLLATRIGFGRRASAAQVAFTARMMSSTPTETLVAAVGSLSEFDNVERLKAIDVPSLIVAGDRDVIAPIWLAREMAARIPGAELVVLPGAGHMGMLERPDRFTEMVRTFAERVLS